MTCMWKGTLKDGRLICGNDPSVTVFTTDKDLVECIKCKQLLGRKINKYKHTHLNVDFLSHVKILKNKISFNKHKEIAGIPMCKLSSGPRTLWKLTNNPKEITCSHCLKSVWGSRDAKKYILKGILVELGHPYKYISKKLREFSNDELRGFLDDLLEDRMKVTDRIFKLKDKVYEGGY
tara:strand:+ start:574 stop:1107 length:534 start_codon:yes stop_codon:yes gene_type:complete